MTASSHLRSLVVAYARALDRRDRTALASIFSTDAVLETVWTAENGRVDRLEGLDAIGTIVRVLARWDSTVHVLGESEVLVTGVEASIRTPCVAHHLTHGAFGIDDLRMDILYDDGCRLVDAAWRVVHRRIEILATRQHAVMPESTGWAT